MNESNFAPMVLDNGSETVKVNLANDTEPLVLPNVAGYPNRDITIGCQREYCLQDALDHYGRIHPVCPIERGEIEDWEHMELVWNAMFYHSDFRVNNAEWHSLLITDTPKGIDIKKMYEIMFEKLLIPRIYVAVQEQMALFASNKTTGVVLESGYGKSRVVPISNGQVIKEGILPLDVNGDDLTRYFAKLLTDRGYKYTSRTERIMACEAKEEHCFVALDYEKELVAASDKSYEKSHEFNHTETILMDKEMFKCPEALFKPAFLGKSSPGVHETIYNSIMACSPDIQKDLFANIYISGGNTMYNGLADRLQKEISLLTTNPVTVYAPDNRKHSVWYGSAAFALQPEFPSLCFSIKTYEEEGHRISTTAREINLIRF